MRWVWGLAADCLHPRIITLKYQGTLGYSEIPASYGICSYQLSGSGPHVEAVALPDELAAQIVKDQMKARLII